MRLTWGVSVSRTPAKRWQAQNGRAGTVPAPPPSRPPRQTPVRGVTWIPRGPAPARPGALLLFFFFFLFPHLFIKSRSVIKLKKCSQGRCQNVSALPLRGTRPAGRRQVGAPPGDQPTSRADGVHCPGTAHTGLRADALQTVPAPGLPVALSARVVGGLPSKTSSLLAPEKSSLRTLGQV